MAKKDDKKKEDKAKVHKDLDGLDLKINEFGEVIGNTKIEAINEFLSKKVKDKKLEDRAGKYGKKGEDDKKS